MRICKFVRVGLGLYVKGSNEAWGSARRVCEFWRRGVRVCSNFWGERRKCDSHSLAWIWDCNCSFFVAKERNA